MAKKKTLYETLDVPKDASAAAIKKAYRKKAKATHPDAGGSDDEFKDVQAAYKILTDESRRARYDATGEEGDQVDQGFAEVVAVLSQMFSRLLDGIIAAEEDPATKNIFGMMLEGLAHGRESLVKQRLHFQEAKLKLEKTLGRVTVDDGPNFLRDVVAQKIKLAEANLQSAEAELNKVLEAIKLLKKFKYKSDPVAEFNRMAERSMWGTRNVGPNGEY